MRAPVSYGPRARAVIAYLLGRRHLPTRRVAEAMADLFGLEVSTGAVDSVYSEASRRLRGFIAVLVALLRTRRRRRVERLPLPGVEDRAGQAGGDDRAGDPVVPVRPQGVVVDLAFCRGGAGGCRRPGLLPGGRTPLAVMLGCQRPGTRPDAAAFGRGPPISAPGAAPSRA